MSVLEYLSMTLLIVIAFVIYQAKSRYFLAQPKCYRNLMIGLTAFLGVFLIRALGAAGVFQALAGVNGLIVESLLQATFLILGGLFAGVALVHWLPRLAESQLWAQKLHDRLSLLEAVTATRSRITEPEALALEIRRLLRLVFRAVEIEIYRYSNATATLSPLERPDVEIGKNTGIYQFCSEALLTGANWLARAGIESDHRALAMSPVSGGQQQTYLLLFVWSPGCMPDTSDEQLLRLLRSQFNTRTIENYVSDYRPAFARLRAQLAGAERLTDELLELDSTLREITGHELLRLAVFDERGLNVTQYALGSGQSVLTERDKSISTNKTRLGAMFVEPQVTICDNLAASDFSDDQWLAQCGATRAISIPLVGPERVLAVLTLASVEAELEVCRDEDFQRELIDTLLPLVQADLLTQQSIAFNRRVLDLTATLKEVVEAGGGEQVLTTITDTIVRQFPATAAQVWRLDQAAGTFTLAAASFAHTVDSELETRTTVPVAEANWRRLALRTRKLAVYNHAIAAEAEVPPAVLPNLKSALFVPLISGEAELGVLVIAEVRNPERRRFSLSETLFARGMASIVTLALLTKNQPQPKLDQLISGNRLLEPPTSLERVFQLPQRLATPLTSILARSQQLLGSDLGKDEPSKRSLQIIGEQAELIIREMRDVQAARQEQIFS